MSNADTLFSSLTEKESVVLRALFEQSATTGHDFGSTAFVDYRALGLTKQGFAALYGSLLAKGVFQWSETGNDVNGDPLGSQYALEDFVVERFKSGEVEQ